MLYDEILSLLYYNTHRLDGLISNTVPQVHDANTRGNCGNLQSEIYIPSLLPQQMQYWYAEIFRYWEKLVKFPKYSIKQFLKLYVTLMANMKNFWWKHSF